MLRSIFLAAALTLPLAAGAITLHEGQNWRNCSDDSECVAIQGKCSLTGVNMDYKDAAAAYYRQEAAKATCTERFWKPKSEMVRCRLGSCETYARPAAKSKTTK